MKTRSKRAKEAAEAAAAPEAKRARKAKVRQLPRSRGAAARPHVGHSTLGSSPPPRGPADNTFELKTCLRVVFPEAPHLSFRVPCLHDPAPQHCLSPPLR